MKERFCRLCCAINSLPETQGRRVEAHFLLGKSIKEIPNARIQIRAIGKKQNIPLSTLLPQLKNIQTTLLEYGYNYAYKMFGWNKR